jgi:hypothetical protein
MILCWYFDLRGSTLTCRILVSMANVTLGFCAPFMFKFLFKQIQRNLKCQLAPIQQF